MLHPRLSKSFYNHSGFQISTRAHAQKQTLIVRHCIAFNDMSKLLTKFWNTNTSKDKTPSQVEATKMIDCRLVGTDSRYSRSASRTWRGGG